MVGFSWLLAISGMLGYLAPTLRPPSNPRSRPQPVWPRYPRSRYAANCNWRNTQAPVHPTKSTVATAIATATSVPTITTRSIFTSIVGPASPAPNQRWAAAFGRRPPLIYQSMWIASSLWWARLGYVRCDWWRCDWWFRCKMLRTALKHMKIGFPLVTNR